MSFWALWIQCTTLPSFQSCSWKLTSATTSGLSHWKVLHPKYLFVFSGWKSTALLLARPHCKCSNEPGSKLVVLGMVIPPLIWNPYNGYINPYYWVDDHPLLYGNNGSLDPSTNFPTINPQNGLPLLPGYAPGTCRSINCPWLWAKASRNSSSAWVGSTGRFKVSFLKRQDPSPHPLVKKKTCLW